MRASAGSHSDVRGHLRLLLALSTFHKSGILLFAGAALPSSRLTCPNFGQCVRAACKALTNGRLDNRVH